MRRLRKILSVARIFESRGLHHPLLDCVRLCVVLPRAEQVAASCKMTILLAAIVLESEELLSSSLRMVNMYLADVSVGKRGVPWVLLLLANSVIFAGHDGAALAKDPLNTKLKQHLKCLLPIIRCWLHSRQTPNLSVVEITRAHW